MPPSFFVDNKNEEFFFIIFDMFSRILEINSLEGNILSKIINLIYVLDYASIYHAIINEVNPTPVNAIDFIKSQLK